MKNLAIFASGAGSNAEKILDYFKVHPAIRVELIVSNKPGAGVLAIAEQWGKDTLIIEKEGFFSENSCLKALKDHKIDFIVLAGFLWKIPEELVAAYPRRIVNIHPALLPKYGGKGMYGERVHAAVIAAGERESGITIHYVDERYDEGDIIFQDTCTVEEGEGPAALAAKIHALEHAHFARVIEEVVVG